jgi:hypothetical protein
MDFLLQPLPLKNSLMRLRRRNKWRQLFKFNKSCREIDVVLAQSLLIYVSINL